MPFEIKINGEGSFETIILCDTATGCEVEIYCFGALLNSFSVKTKNCKTNVVDGFSSPLDAKENITNGFKSAKLSPFVCRLSEGKYSFEDNKHTINKFYIGASAIHGLIYDAAFTITQSIADDEKAFVTLGYQYSKQDEGFPFAYHTEVTYLLQKNNSLTLITTITNTDERNMPLSDGWHPYFRLGETINELLVQINCKEMAEFNESLLPTGKLVAFSSFSSPQKFGDTFFDNCFVINENAYPACTLEDRQTGLKLEIIPGSSYPYLQIYTPAHRKSIAIENLSSVPDAFNNSVGLIISKPGQQNIFTTTYRLSVTK